MRVDWSGPFTIGDHRIVKVEGGDFRNTVITCRLCGVIYDKTGWPQPLPNGHTWP